MNAIDIRSLRKAFGPVHALDGLDLTVAPGQVMGFLGPNGSGKSTTIRVLLGLLRADAGEVSLLGGDPWRDAVALHRRLAYVPGDVSLWPNLTGGEAIDLISRLRGGVNKARKEELLARFELDPSKKARTYSKGNRQKVALVAALASDAELLVLDEPTSGLDPLMEGVFQACIEEYRDEGRAVLLSSHILAEVEKLCDAVTIIRAGRTVESGTLDELRHLTRTSVTLVTDAADAAAVLGGHRWAHDVAEEAVGARRRVSFDVDNTDLPAAMRAVADLEPHAVTSAPPSLEELFLRHYGDELAALNGASAAGASPKGAASHA